MWSPVIDERTTAAGKRIFSQIEDENLFDDEVNYRSVGPQKWICERILLGHKSWVNSLFFSREFNFLARYISILFSKYK